jgi:hypothetical protein
MRADAEDYLAAARALVQVHHAPGSFAASLLAFIGLELLIKLVFEVETDRKAPPNHKLREIVDAFPDATNSALALEVGRRASGHFDGTLSDALKDWGESIVKMRYPYDFDRGMSDEAHQRRNAAWVRDGVPMDRAQFPLHPILFAAAAETLLRWTAPVANRDYRLDIDRDRDATRAESLSAR